MTAASRAGGDRGTARKRFVDLAGRICEAVIPVRQEFFVGRGREAAICTLASMRLLREISCRQDIMNKVAIAGRLLSENRGIDAIIAFAVSHPDLRRIIVCGRDSKGHRAGQALLALHRNGTGPGGRIIGALGPYPLLKSPAPDIEAFRKQVRITTLDLEGAPDDDPSAVVIDRLASCL